MVAVIHQQEKVYICTGTSLRNAIVEWLPGHEVFFEGSQLLKVQEFSFCPKNLRTSTYVLLDVSNVIIGTEVTGTTPHNAD